eukprot:CAMPEP_0177705662 /NCGR_PEP_ID=MMETSP0484_2-20121128/8825_1 /TAXON_ID=354590 /ORGANISM="Rhodomonas lens, Strain RHODO" /LENGTH=217 /DNA_ID=CAMNT_0019217099 /DNA_START=97 /DNA_END=750 /DNA_ORIENTATION=-
MAKTQKMLLIAACVAALLSTVNCASLISSFMGAPPMLRDDMLGFANPAMAPKSVLRSMHDMERVADSILSHLLEDNANAGDNEDETEEEKGLVALRGLHLRPRFELQETHEGVVLTVLTPGLRKQDLTVEVLEHDNVPTLVIAGGSNHTSAKSEDGSSDAKAPQPSKASYAKFERRIRIPHNVDRASVKADYQDGMLTVSMQRKTLAAPQKQRVLIH